MFQRIMVPLDGSRLAESVLPLAADFARAFDAELLLLRAASARPHVDSELEADAQVQAVTTAEQYLEAIAMSDQLQGVRATTSVPYGRAAEMIIDIAKARSVDLIVMATHGRSGIARWALGSVADRVLHGFRGQLLVVRPQAPQNGATHYERPAHVVIPLDGSELAEQALGTGEVVARQLGLQLHLVRVVPVAQVVETMDGTALEAEESRTDLERRAAEQYLTGLLKRLAARGVEAEVLVRVGDAADQIMQAARALAPAIIVMSTHGRSGVSRWIFGSVADRLIRHSAVPVLVRRAAGSERLLGQAERPA